MRTTEFATIKNSATGDEIFSVYVNGLQTYDRTYKNGETKTEFEYIMDFYCSERSVGGDIILSRTVTVPRDVIENVFVSALEGGSNYWYYLPESSVDAIRKAVPKSKEPSLSMAMAEAILDHGVEVAINDADNEDETIGYISKFTMQQRLQAMMDKEEYRWALNNELDEGGDANSSDVVMQFITMGEVVFG
jgi:hypothetical protein